MQLGIGSWVSQSFVGLLVGRAWSQFIPGQGLTCCGPAGSAGWGILVFVDLVSALWWVNLLQRLEEASWRIGPVPVCWCVEPGPVLW